MPAGDRTANAAAPPYRQPVEAVLLALGVDGRAGLSAAEARERLARHGRNELRAEAKAPAWKRFLAQFQDVLVVLLLVATAISATLWVIERDAALPYEAMAILAIVLLNAVLGYVQESRAEASVAALRQMSAAQARVVRDGERRTVPAAEVVPGEVIVVEEGDTVPADARLIRTAALQTAESALTGESLPVAKDPLPIAEDAVLGDRHNMLFSGTAVASGRGRAVVVATGMATEMGRIAGMLEAAPAERTPLQNELDRVGRVLGVVVVAIAVVMILTIVLVEDVRGFAALFEVLMLGVALAVAAVPFLAQRRSRRPEHLSALEAELHPHFLFNTLNSIATLMHEDVDAADEMMAKLATLLRRTMDRGTVEIALKEELEILEIYLDIQRTRYEDRLTTEVTADPDALDVLVPRLVLQPVVENAVSHGISRRTAAGRIAVRAQCRDGALRLTVTNDGAGWPPKSAGGSGLGLKNTLARLKRFDRRCTFDLREGGDRGAVATLTLPVRR